MEEVGRRQEVGGRSQEEGGRRQIKESRRQQKGRRMKGNSYNSMFQIADNSKLLPGVDCKIVVWVEEE